MSSLIKTTLELYNAALDLHKLFFLGGGEGCPHGYYRYHHHHHHHHHHYHGGIFVLSEMEGEKGNQDWRFIKR